RGAPARIAHARGVVAHDQHDPVPEILELAQLLQDDGVAEVDVWRGRVQTELGPQLAPLALGRFQAALQPAGGPRLRGVARGESGGVCGRRHRWAMLVLAAVALPSAAERDPPRSGP